MSDEPTAGEGSKEHPLTADAGRTPDAPDEAQSGAGTLGPDDPTGDDSEPEPTGDAPAAPGVETGAEPTRGDSAEDASDEVETTYESTPAGHRITRRTIRRTTRTSNVVEDVEETVTEDVPLAAYQAPRTGDHPAPVG